MIRIAFVGISTTFLIFLIGCSVEYKAPLNTMPKGVVFNEGLRDRLTYNAVTKELILEGYLNKKEWKELLSLSSDSAFQSAVNSLFEWSFNDETISSGLLTLSIQEEIEGITQKVVSSFEKKNTEGKINLIIRKTKKEVIDDIVEKRSRAGFILGGNFKELNDMFNKKNVKAKAKVIFRDAPCLITHPENKQTGFTTGELKGTLLGKIRNWKDVMGESRRILIFTSGKSYIKSLADSLKIDIDLEQPFITICKNNKSVIEKVHETKGSLGIVGMEDMRHALSIKKEHRDTTTFRSVSVARSARGLFYKPFQGYVFNGKYPFSIDGILISVGGTGRFPIGFSSFVANGNNGQQIFMSEGLIPMTQKIVLKKN